MTNNSEPESPLRIGAVARLTGLSPHTLRKWEDRYAAVLPERTQGGERVYTRQDLQRLMLIRNLSRAGLALRSLAKTSLADLQKMEQELGDQAAQISAEGLSRPVRMAVIGTSVASMLDREPSYLDNLEIIATAETVDGLMQRLGEMIPDILTYEVPAVSATTFDEVTDLRNRTSVQQIMLVYGYASREHLRHLADQGAVLLRRPVDRRELQRNAVQMAREAGLGQAKAHELPVTAPRLSSAALARAAAAAPQIKCECPHHLVDLLHSLRAFEDYSAACENSSAEDAELHHYLWLTTARARMTFEDALIKVAAAEGIRLDVD